MDQILQEILFKKINKLLSLIKENKLEIINKNNPFNLYKQNQKFKKNI